MLAPGCSLKVSYTIPLDSLLISLVATEETEFTISSPVRSCSLRARNLHERNAWLEALNSAVEEQRSRKASFSKAGEEEVEELEAAGRCERLPGLGDRAPVWVPDRAAGRCQQCGAVFSLTCRRHHCRACGELLCSGCTDNKAPLRYTQFQPARVCHLCFSLLLAAHGEDPELRQKFRQTRKVSALARTEVERSGQLSLRVGTGQWRRASYRLSQGWLHSYPGEEDREDSQPAESLNMSDFTSIAGEGLAAFILSGHRQLHFLAESQEARDGWMEALSQCLATSITSNTDS